jgi:hypothetical protein
VRLYSSVSHQPFSSPAIRFDDDGFLVVAIVAMLLLLWLLMNEHSVLVHHKALLEVFHP